ncbi:MAG: cation diffusion facilitator family transporter [Planctomycetia bacterium]|nr:cation diffusion facilitator family transporter [Planctomycetia bacterium]
MSQQSRTIRNITLLGAVCNFLLVIFKLLAGFWGNSRVLIADAVHSLSDFVTDLVVIVGAAFWTRPADQEHPYGHSKLESLITLFIGAALALAGVLLVCEAVGTLREIMAGKESLESPKWIAFFAAAVSVVVKEFLYRVTARVGRRCHSPAVIANAWHHRTDALSSIPAGLAVACTLILGPFYTFLDPVGTILVGGMIVHAAWQIVYPTLGTLMDAGASAECVEQIRRTVLSFPGTSDPHKIRTRYLGDGSLEVDLHLHVDGNMTVRDAHFLSHQIEKKLLNSGLRIAGVIIHIEPLEKT